MVTISDSTIRQNVYKTIYDLINTNMSSWSTSKAAVLYGGYPDWESTSFPAIITNPTKVDESERVIGNNNSTKFITMTIEVFAKVGRDLDILNDGITQMLRDNSISGLTLGDIGEDEGVIYPNEFKLKQKTLTINFKRR